MSVQIHALQQRTQEWHDWRANHATASHAACVMGVAAFEPRTQRQLVEVMHGVREIFVTDAMKRGGESEGRITQLYEAERGLTGAPLVVSQGYLGASLDWAYQEDPFAPITFVAEFKTPVKGSESKLWKAETVDDVPIHIRMQIQHQYMVSDCNEIELVVYAHDLDKIKRISIPADPECQGALREQWDIFWDHFTSGEQPPAEPRDIKEVDDPTLHQLLSDWDYVQIEMRELKDREKELRDQITGYANECSIRCNGTVVERVMRKGSIDWRELCDSQQLHDSLIEQFRKPSTVYHKIRSA